MESDIASLLKQLVSVKSTYPDEKEIGEYLFQLFQSHNYNPKKQIVENNRFNLTVQKGHGKKSVLLYSHLDTVNVVEGWQTDPLELNIKNGKAFGLGAWDMKGGMAVNILTFLRFHPKNFRLKLVFCVDEENISKGVQTLIKTNFINDVDCVISPEPAFDYGLRGIVTGRIGRAVYNIEIKGESRHFALYEKMYDINLFAAEFLVQISRLNRIIGHRKQFIFARKIISEAVGMSIPPKTCIQLDSSVLPPNTHNQILDCLAGIGKNLSKKYGNYFSVKLGFLQRDTPFLESYQIKDNNPYLKLLKKSIGQKTGLAAQDYFRSSVADENVFGSHGKTVLGIGAHGGNAHAANEWVSLSSLEKLYIILNSFLEKVNTQI